MPGLIIWSVGLIVLLLLMGVGIAMWRKQVARGDQTPAKGFTLGDLRELHRRGKMTDAEFEAAKGLVLRDLKQAAAEPQKRNRTSGPGKSA